MERQPKLRIKGIGWQQEGEVWEFEQARYLAYHDRNSIITVENQIIHSFEDLVSLAQSEEHRHKDILEVNFLPIIVGG